MARSKATMLTVPVPGTLGRILRGAKLRARLTIERDDGAPFTQEESAAIKAMLSVVAKYAARTASSVAVEIVHRPAQSKRADRSATIARRSDERQTRRR